MSNCINTERQQYLDAKFTSKIGCTIGAIVLIVAAIWFGLSEDLRAFTVYGSIIAGCLSAFGSKLIASWILSKIRKCSDQHCTNCTDAKNN